MSADSLNDWSPGKTSSQKPEGSEGTKSKGRQPHPENSPHKVPAGERACVVRERQKAGQWLE